MVAADPGAGRFALPSDLAYLEQDTATTTEEQVAQVVLQPGSVAAHPGIPRLR
jgi:hypothetical protein